MEKIKYNDVIYNVVDIINFDGTYHLIIMKDDEIYYINRKDENYYAPPKDLNVHVTTEENLTYIRKQYILKVLINYIKENNMFANIKDVTAVFKDYITTVYVETFLYWPYMTERHFINEMKALTKDLETYMNNKLHNHVLAADNETIVVIDNYIAPTKFLPEDDYVTVPIFKKK